MSEQVISFEPEITRHILELERRFADRRSLRLPVLCFLDPTHECLGAGIRDISLRGVGLDMNRRLEADSRILVCLEGTARRSLYALAARVVRATPDSRN